MNKSTAINVEWDFMEMGHPDQAQAESTATNFQSSCTVAGCTCNGWNYSPFNYPPMESDVCACDSKLCVDCSPDFSAYTDMGGFLPIGFWFAYYRLKRRIKRLVTR
jgi:hypothetical protein